MNKNNYSSDMEKEMLQILENSSMRERETKAVYSELLNLFNVSEMFYVMVDDKKILSVHRTEKGAKHRKKEWEDSRFDGVFTVHKIELED